MSLPLGAPSTSASQNTVVRPRLTAQPSATASSSMSADRYCTCMSTVENRAFDGSGPPTTGTTTLSSRPAIAPPCTTPAAWLSAVLNGMRIRQ